MRRSLIATGALLFALTVIPATPAFQAKKGNETVTDADKAGPDFLVQGEYEGTLDGKDKIGAQLIALGDGKFAGHFLTGGLPGAAWDAKTKMKLEAKTVDGKTAVTGTWPGTIADGILTGKSAEGKAYVLKHVMRKSPTEGAKPPDGAVVLFDGTNADGWSKGKLVEGNLLNNGINSKKAFGDVKLHVEFRCPYMPYARGQGRGNSGVFLQGHEVQVLDSFGLDSKKDDCAALYGQTAPSLNMCLPPLAWQTYDIEYQVPRYEADGSKKSDAIITVLHNGVKVLDKLEIKGTGDKKGGDKPATIQLQDHGNPVYFRNIWAVETK